MESQTGTHPDDAEKRDDLPSSSGNVGALNGTETALSEGLNTDDPVQMKAALENAQAQLATMKKHMQMCPMMSGMDMGAGAHEHHMMKGQAQDKHKPE